MSPLSLLRCLGSVAVLLGGLVGCQPTSAPPFQVATNVWSGYEPLYLARQLGRLDAREVRLVEMSNSTDSIRAMRAGLLAGAALTLDEAFLLLQDGMDLRVVLVLDISCGADAIIGRPELRSPKDLKGRRVGVENSAVGAYLLSRALDQAGLKPADVTLVPLTADTHLTAFRLGTVDALVTFEPTRSLLLAEGGVKIFDSGSIPNEIFDVLVLRAEEVRRRPAAVARLRDAWFAAQAHLARDPSDAVRRMAPREGVSPEFFRQSLEGISFPDRAQEARLRAGELLPPARRLASLMFERQLLDRPVDPALLLSPP